MERPGRWLDLPVFRRQTLRMVVHQAADRFKKARQAHPVSFHRTELSLILAVYGRMVAAGEWRDYGISSLTEVAVFSIFRRTAENPVYRIEKRPKLARRQGQYAIIGMDGQVLKRGQDLKTVLRLFDKNLIRAV